ncbi:DUF4153 domain-containing protein [Campylobacter sp. faydin G-105]|uniref:DUF4153 domain-containing protein n=1 Tax=Campylobacter anatolicus TaxID=2829105 RepID=UPI001B9EE8A2|nr:DUF4153 domain-containing protein [Campylobacter anatolicus]MBR8461533.1 DUF4153 domain-containing protein [Campylobacter anatolicus]
MLNLSTLKATIMTHKIEFLLIFVSILPLFILRSRYLDFYNSFLLFTPLFIILSYILRQKKSIYIFSLIIAIIGFCIIDYIDEKPNFYLKDIKFYALYMILSILLLAHKFIRDNEKFVKNAFDTLMAFATAFAISHICYLAIIAVLAGLEYLFDIKVFRSELSLRLYAIAVIGILPTVFFILKERYSFNIGVFLSVIVNFILSPLLIIYTAFIYIYTTNIAIFSGLPRGGVSFIVLSYLFIGFIITALNLISAKPKWQLFYRYFAPLSLVPIMLLWFGISRRVGEYGITPERFYLIAISLFATFTICFLHFKRNFSYRLVAVVAALFVIGAVFVLNAEQISLKSQKARAYAMFEKFGFLKNGEFVKEFNATNLELQYEQKFNILNDLDFINSHDNNFQKQTKSFYKAIENIDTYNSDYWRGYCFLDSSSHDLTGYKSVKFLNIYVYNQDNIKINAKRNYDINVTKHIQNVLKNNGISMNNFKDLNIKSRQNKEICSEFLKVNTPDSTLIFNNIEIEYDKNLGYIAKFFEVIAILEKE